MTYLRLILIAAAVVPLATVSRHAWGQGASDDETPTDDGWFTEEEEQETPAAETEEPPAVATEPPVAETAPAAAVAAPKVDAPQAPAPPDAGPRTGRFRWGLSPHFGAAKYSDEDEYMFQMGLEARFGGQLSDEFAIYADPSILGSETLRVATGVVFEGCFGDVLSLGGGLDVAVNSKDDWSDFRPGGGPTARIGIHIGKDKPNRRKAFSMYAVSKVDFYFDGEHMIMMGGMLGYDGM